jgi:hypothetical protein
VTVQRPLVFHDSPHDDWLVLPSWNRLHRIQEIAWEGGSPEEECQGQGRALCGAEGWFYIPGFLSRMGLPRCAHCCDKLGIPRGNGNTLNRKITEPTHA